MRLPSSDFKSPAYAIPPPRPSSCLPGDCASSCPACPRLLGIRGPMTTLKIAHRLRACVSHARRLREQCGDARTGNSLPSFSFPEIPWPPKVRAPEGEAVHEEAERSGGYSSRRSRWTTRPSRSCRGGGYVELFSREDRAAGFRTLRGKFGGRRIPLGVVRTNVVAAELGDNAYVVRAARHFFDRRAPDRHSWGRARSLGDGVRRPGRKRWSRTKSCWRLSRRFCGTC